MSRSITASARRTPALLMAVVAAGFVVAGVAVGLVHVVTGHPLAWAAIGLFAAVAIATVAVTGVVAWMLPGGDDAPTATADGDATFASRRRLLDDIRHELKTPIAIVRGHLEIMDPTDPDDVAGIRDLGIAELDRMTRLIGDIDLLASVETDSFRMGEVSLAVLTGRLFDLVAVIGGHQWRVEQTAGAVIRGDGDRLLQAWLQLADNAAKYTPVGSPIEIGSAVHPSAAQLWVRDHGPGVPPAMRHRVFRRFDRGTGRRSVGGSGLGLAIVETIADAHGGRCRITDTPGGGATFTIELPIGTRAPLPAPVRAGDVVTQREGSA